MITRRVRIGCSDGGLVWIIYRGWWAVPTFGRMDIDTPNDAAPPAVPVSEDNLSLPQAVLGDLPARARFHRSQDTAARAMADLVRRANAASGVCAPMSAS